MCLAFAIAGKQYMIMNVMHLSNVAGKEKKNSRLGEVKQGVSKKMKHHDNSMVNDLSVVCTCMHLLIFRFKET